jgi:transcriptional regulator with XRE-family HTH domain
MKPFSVFLKKLPAERRARIEESVQSKVTAIQLQHAREQVGVTQEELAARLHMSQPALSRFERRPNVTVGVLRRYVEALGGTLEVNMVLPRRIRSRRTAGARATSLKRSTRRIPLVSA